MMLLEQLSNARGVSGNEAPVRELIIQAIQSRVDEYRVDTLGNLIALKRAAPNGSARRRTPARGAGRKPPRVLIAAHMDEVGLLIQHVDDDGRLRFAKVGGIDDRILLSKVFLIGEHKVPGVIGVKPIHKSTAAERNQVVEADDLTLDIGARSKEEALEAVKIGDYATFATEFAPIGEGLVRGKALDDRTGCALLVDLLAQEYPFDLYAVFTVQEEVGLRGARVAAYAVEPEVAFVLEATIADDSPKDKDLSPTTRLGYGPALTIADGSAISDKRLVQLLTTTAQENSIPLQIKQPLIGGTDAGRVHLAREGIPTISLSVPARYIHSPAALISLGDYENTLRLMNKTLLKLQNGLTTLE